MLFDGLKGHSSLEVIRMCYRDKSLSESVTDNLIELVKTCPNLCGILTRCAGKPEHYANEFRLYEAVCRARNGHVRPHNSGYADAIVPKEWLDRAGKDGGRKDHPHGWSGILNDGLLVFAKQTDEENYAAYQPVKGEDYFEKPKDGKFKQVQDGKEVTYDITEPYFIPSEFYKPSEFKDMADLQRMVAKNRFEKAYDHVTDGFKDGIATPALWQNAADD